MPARTTARISRTASLALVATVAGATAVNAQERAAYLTLMGNDTLAVEWVEFGDGWVEATALIRGSSTIFGQYRLEMAADGTPTHYVARTYEGGSASGEPVRTEMLRDGQMVTIRGGEESARPFEASPGSVPFIDMLHWPFEAALRWQVAQGGPRDAVPTFTGRGMSFRLSRNEDGSWSLRHPSRGPSTLEFDDQGRILWLDGTGSTRAYDLKRRNWDELSMTALGETFAHRPLGELSGRGHIDDYVAGVAFTGDYGAPRRRGRDIFGALLSFGTWWRTGANAATQFSFDRDITIDGVVVPAGDYSLSSIPEENGGVLIINRRTGQGGQSYDSAEDQARVRLRRDRLDERVEVFEIRVVPSAEGGRIELRWDDTVYWVPFTAS